MTLAEKGWFEIPEVQPGDRSISEQMLGLEPALALAKHKTVIDIGCAEGMIALRFAQAGAVSVVGFDFNLRLILTAREQYRKVSTIGTVAFIHEDLRRMIEAQDAADIPKQYDVVLALGVCHKLKQPADGVRFAARASREWVLLRYCPMLDDPYLMTAKHGGAVCDVRPVMSEERFVEDRTLPSTRGEIVQYWRRKEN